MLVVLLQWIHLAFGYRCILTLVVSTGGIQWILWFSVRYAVATVCTEIFSGNALRGKLHQLGSPNLQDIFIGGQASLGRKLASFRKQDGLLGHFFENYLHFFYCLFLIGRRLNAFIGAMYNRYMCPYNLADI